MQSVDPYESSLTWKSWSYSMITSPLRTIQTYSPLRGKQKPNFVHKKAVESIVATSKELLEQKLKEDPTWNVVSYQEFTEFWFLKNEVFSHMMAATISEMYAHFEQNHPQFYFQNRPKAHKYSKCRLSTLFQSFKTLS